jgi:hypothetical protein
MIVTLRENILILNFKGDKSKMNAILDPISNCYEGPLSNREGHNFPSAAIPQKHALAKYKSQCAYVIGIYNTRSLAHELLHAKYFIDSNYRQQIQTEWSNLPIKTKEHITGFLKRLGYSEDVIIDEYQAYRYSEAPNFFGIRL